MQRPSPMTPHKPGAQDIKAMNSRVEWLEDLYFLDGRDDPSHPFHHTYTGLALRYRSEA